jgi:hypothetical protein
VNAALYLLLIFDNSSGPPLTPWAHPVRLSGPSSVRIGAGTGRVQANADLPRVLLDGDTDIDDPAGNERIEVEG